MSLGPALVVLTPGGVGAVALTASGDAFEVGPCGSGWSIQWAGDSSLAEMIDGLQHAGPLGASSAVPDCRWIDAETVGAVVRRAAAIAAAAVS